MKRFYLERFYLERFYLERMYLERMYFERFYFERFYWERHGLLKDTANGKLNMVTLESFSIDMIQNYLYVYCNISFEIHNRFYIR